MAVEGSARRHGWVGIDIFFDVLLSVDIVARVAVVVSGWWCLLHDEDDFDRLPRCRRVGADD